jgi:hypothetical protein
VQRPGSEDFGGVAIELGQLLGLFPKPQTMQKRGHPGSKQLLWPMSNHTPPEVLGELGKTTAISGRLSTILAGFNESRMAAGSIAD